MKTRLSIAIAASLLFCGCSVFHRSPTWESVVASRAQTSNSLDAKDSYLNHLHQVLTNAGVEHKLVSYQFRYHNNYLEEAVESTTAILYRDETTPNHPWWVIDEYHHVPVWLPNWELDAQLEFFIQRPVDVISVKDYAGHSAPEPRVAQKEQTSRRTIAHSAREKKFRALFTGGARRSKPAKPPVTPADSDPLTTKVLSGQTATSGDAADSRAVVLFRTTHGTEFDPGSSVDRAKMNELRRHLLNRSQRISLRAQ